MTDIELCERCDSNPCVCPTSITKKRDPTQSDPSSGVVPRLSSEPDQDDDGAAWLQTTPAAAVSFALLRASARSDDNDDFDARTRVASLADLRDGLIASAIDDRGDFDAPTRVASIADLRDGILGSAAADAVNPFDTPTREQHVPGMLDAFDDALGEALAQAGDDVNTSSNIRSPFEPGEDNNGGDAWFEVATNGSFRLDKLLRASDADAVVLGDPTDVTGSIEIEVITDEGPAVVRQIHLGGDVEKNLEEQTVLVRTAVEVGVLALSPFERFVLQRVDGKKTIAVIQSEMRLSESDLRIALALLLDKRLLEPVVVTSLAAASSPAPPVVVSAPKSPTAPVPPVVAAAPPVVVPAAAPPPPVIVSSSPVVVLAAAPPPPPVIVSSSPVIVTAPQPSSPPPPPAVSTVSSPPPPSAPRSAASIRGATPTAARSFDRSTTSQAGRSLVIDNAQVRAATLFDQSIREVKNGALDKARGLLEQAATLAPNEERYRATLAAWDDFVATHRTPEDMRALALAVRTEDAGDLVKATALLRQATQWNPQNATAWNRLGLILARQKDTRGAVDALSKAVELAPHDAAILSNFTKVAGAAEKGGVDVGLRNLWKRIVK